MGDRAEMKKNAVVVEVSSTRFINSLVSPLSYQRNDAEYIQHMDVLMTVKRFRHRYIRMRGWNIETIGYQSILLYQNYWASYKDTLSILKPLNCPILDLANGGEKLCFLFCVAAALLSLIARVTVPCSQEKH